MNRLGLEDNTTEFKIEPGKNLEKETVAFLNSEKGGDIYIGVDDSGRGIGVQNPDGLMLAISDRIKNNILPSCLGLYDVYPEEHDGKTILHIVVTRGTEKPYYLKKYGQSPAGCYIRVGSGVQQMDVGMIDQLYASRLRNSLRNIPAPTKLKLTFQQLKIYYQEKGFQINDSFLGNLDLFTPDHQLNYAAYLLADKNSVSIKVAKYAGSDKCELIENEEYGFCSLVKATHQVLDKLNIENKTLTQITGAAEREQHRQIDEKALREALINAMVHNDYSSEVPPVVEIYPNKISITSFGGLVPGLSREEFLGGRSMPRNRELMRVFRDLDLVEQLGSGMHRILSAYSSDIFHISENFFEISFDRQDPVEQVTGQQERSKLEPSRHPMNTGQIQLTEHDVEIIWVAFEVATGQLTGQVTGQVAGQVIHFCESPQSAKQIQELLGMKHRETFLNNYLKPLLKSGWITMTHPEKPTSRLQKYRLTPAGLKILKSLNGGRCE